MNRIRLPLALFLVTLLFAACANEAHDGEATHADHASAETTPVVAEVRDGVQSVAVEAGPQGYVPHSVTLQANVPARFVFTRTVESACSSQVQIPDFDVPVTDLPLGEPVAIEFTPTEGGTFAFICGMDMQRGGILIRS